MVYVKGQKVIVYIPQTYNPRGSLNGHTCIVREVVPMFNSCYYILEWTQEDNPGQECGFGINSVLWADEELIPCFNTPVIKTIKSIGLPNI